MSKRIAIVGPESTGKSELSESLALHFKTAWVPEFARQYLEKLNRPYQYDDLLLIAKGQIKEEKKRNVSGAEKYLFCDTDLIVIKIWSLHKYGKCHNWILSQIKKRKYSLHLLTAIDLPWEIDPLREHPHLRQFFFDWYKNELNEYRFPYRIINGLNTERTGNAVREITNFFDQ